MLDYYGRIVVIDSPGEGDDRELDAIGKWLVGRLETLKPGPDLLDVRWVDGTQFLTFSGQRDPRDTYFDDLLRVIQELAARAPGSYGTIHYHDDDPDHPFTNEFRVIALARGRLVEHPDPFLSPVIPTIEDPVEID